MPREGVVAFTLCSCVGAAQSASLAESFQRSRGPVCIGTCAQLARPFQRVQHRVCNDEAAVYSASGQRMALTLHHLFEAQPR